MHSRARIVLLLASLTGAVFCILNAAGADLLCLTEGCRIYASYGIFGLSFYTLGAAAFVFLFVLALLQSRRPVPALLAIALTLGFLLDTLFLAWQTLFWPCLGCLTVAFLLGVAGAAGLSLVPRPARKALLGIGAIWLLFFFAVGLAAGREIGLKPWAIAGDPSAPIKLFFSPECPACRQTITDLLKNTEAASRTAFFPVAKGEEDRRRLATFLAVPRSSVRPEDLLALFEDAPEAPPLALGARLGLLANKAALARTGAVTVPLIITPEIPESDASRFELGPPPDGLFSPPPESGCPAFEETKCD